jgi:hypothetical protein
MRTCPATGVAEFVGKDPSVCLTVKTKFNLQCSVKRYICVAGILIVKIGLPLRYEKVLPLAPEDILSGVISKLVTLAIDIYNSSLFYFLIWGIS